MNYFFAILGSYFVGSIPFGLLIARAMGVDILKVGSGNIGATNVYRTLGPVAGILVLAADVLKGLAPTLAAKVWLQSNDWGMVAGMAAAIGHMLSPFLHFKGGKGVATTLGVLFGGSWMVASTALASFLLVLLIPVTRYVSLGAMIAAVIAVVACGLLHVSTPVFAIFSALCALIIYKHRANAKRLLAGTEPKFEPRPKKKTEEGEVPSPTQAVVEEDLPVGGKL